MVVKNPEEWRAITPWVTITNLFISICVAIIGFFLIRTLDGLDKSITKQSDRIDQIVADATKTDRENDQRYSQLKYQCCSELKNYAESNVSHSTYQQDGS